MADEQAAMVPGAGYQRHRPEETLLYQIVEQHYPKSSESMSE